MLTKQDFANLAALMERPSTVYNGIADAMYAVVLHNKLKSAAQDEEVDSGSSDPANGTE